MTALVSAQVWKVQFIYSTALIAFLVTFVIVATPLEDQIYQISIAALHMQIEQFLIMQLGRQSHGCTRVD